MIKSLTVKYISDIQNSLFISFFLFSGGLSASGQAQKADSTNRHNDRIKKGWNFGALPVLTFDSEVGFKYGTLANLYNFGDGSGYPKYNHSIYAEWSRTTKGSGINQLRYDSEHLVPNIRVTAEADLMTEQALDFYGFNGYNAYYNPRFETSGDPKYISGVYYRYSRKEARLMSYFQGNIIGRTLRWTTGISYFNDKISSVDIARLNRGRSGADIYPDTALLYDNFVKWGIIKQDQKNGGTNTYVQFGAVADTRDNEPNPMKGIWTELLFVVNPSVLGNKYSFSKLVFTHRQYFTLVRDRLSFAYRLSYQKKLSGEIPFYLLPVLYTSNTIRNGLGGSKTLRGILRNRILGNDLLFGNVELRWKFVKTTKFNQNFYFALAGFTDAGKVTGKYKFSTTGVPVSYSDKGELETWHISYGGGFYGAMNQNFIASVNYGLASDKRDGSSGLYIGLDFLF